jgi:hypothetical protein
MDEAIRNGHAESRKEFMARAIRQALERIERRTIDEHFAEMATDPVYQAEALRVAEDFATAGWEALQAAEESE